MCELNREWIVIGSSPSAGEWLEVVDKKIVGISITTNRGIELFGPRGDPDVYFFGDERLSFPDLKIFDEYREAARLAKKGGTKIVGLARAPEVLTEWDIDWLDEFLTIEVGCWRPWKFIPGKYTACRLSGLFCLQYAINNGATAVHLVGMEGYGDSGHYFDGGKDSQFAKDANLTEQTIRPFTQAVVNACPGVAFHFYGELNYLVTGDNVTLHKDLSKCNSNSFADGGASDPSRSETCPMEPPTS